MNEPPLYRIVDYNDHFENNKSRVRERCSFVCVPNKHGGTGLSNIMGEHDGAMIYGIWMWILQLCSRQRAPREGWLTADGKKTGRRLSNRELAILFRRPVDEIDRTLQVISSPEVAFLEILDGQPAYLHEGHSRVIARTPDGHSERTECLEPGHLMDTPSAPSAIEGVPERKKERKKFSLSGEQEEQNTYTVRTPDGHSKGTECSDLIQHAEAKLILGKLASDVFPDEAQGVIWNNQIEHDLDEQLPLKRETLQKIDWAYRLPHDHDLFDEKRGRMMRVESFRNLIPNLTREASKITRARQRLGLNGLGPATDHREVGDGWTDQRRKAAHEILGEGADLPNRFVELGASVRRRVDEKVEALA